MITEGMLEELGLYACLDETDAHDYVSVLLDLNEVRKRLAIPEDLSITLDRELMSVLEQYRDNTEIKTRIVTAEREETYLEWKGAP